MEKRVTLYVWSYCPYCKRAVSLLQQKGIPYQEFSIDGDAPAFESLAVRTGQRSVPFIFIDDSFIGGFDQLKAMDREMKLEFLIP